MNIANPIRATRLIVSLVAPVLLSVLFIRITHAETFNRPAVDGHTNHVIALNGADTVGAEFCVGETGNIAVEFQFHGGTSRELLGLVKADSWQRTVENDGVKSVESVPMPDGLIEFSSAGLKFQYHRRPHLVRYTEAQQVDLAKTWETLPAASQAWISLEVRATPMGAELWMDGRYCGCMTSETQLEAIRFRLEAGGQVRGKRTYSRVDQGLFLPLAVRHIARPGVMKDAVVSLKPGERQIGSVPMTVGSGATNADVGMAKKMQGLRSLETNEYTSRTSLDGMKESLHFSVPQAFYHRVWVLCAVEGDAKKDPVLTTRLTRFAVLGRGGAIADTTIVLPRGDQKPGENIQIVGNVEYETADRRKMDTPLYLVKVDLKAGEIFDLLADQNDPYAAMKIGPYLDFEFLGKCGGLEVQRDRRREPDPTSTSDVHVFGATLEKSPIEVRLKQTQPGNIFHNDEVPETTFALRALVAGKYSLRWEITDVEGRVLEQRERSVELASPGSEADVVVPLSMANLGWYGLRVAFLDSEKRTLLTHEAAFALLGPDTRTAGYDSPFGTWWFNGVHYTTRDVNVAGPMLFKAGMRRTPFEWSRHTEADFAPWKISHNQIKWRFRLLHLKDWPAAEARAEEVIGDMLKRFPHCRYVDLFHESSNPGGYPPELYDEKYEVDDAALVQREDQIYELGLRAAKFFRTKFPQLKIIAGNSGGSSGIVAMMGRRGFPRELFDYLGSETTGQTIAPEKLSPHTTAGIWLLGETARKFGYDAPLTGCFEFTARAERDLGAQRHAEWYARDMLIGLAHRFPTVSPAEIEDVGNAYYDTLWGAAGLCQRQPLHYPKPAYVALATLTKVLDSVTLRRQMPTGSSSAHALEFERGKERIYALWTPRGQCEMAFEFPEDTMVTQIEFYGRQHPLKTKDRKLVVTAEGAVTYILSPVAATHVLAGRRSFPNHQPPLGTQVISPLDDVSQWQLASEEFSFMKPLHRPGKFELRQADDSDKGTCLELKLTREGDVPQVVGEYAALRLKQPLPIAGKPHTVGAWVKGNSSWGRIIWEIEDARGERWRSSKGTELDDWGDQSAIDFDGWCFMTFPLTNDSPTRHLEPGAGLGQWEHSGGDGKLDFPIKLMGLVLVTHRQSLDLTQMKPVTESIRLKNVSSIGEAR